MPPSKSINLLPHQYEFMMDEHRYVALIGGFGCGKSFGIGAKSFRLASLNQGFDGMIVSRTGEQLKKLLKEVLKSWFDFGLVLSDLDYKKFLRDGVANSFIRYGDRQLVIKWADGLFSNVYLGVTENYAYEKWAGGNLAWVVIDEIDTMAHAEEVFSFAGDRIRVGPFNQTACASTPEGFGFLWSFFEQAVIKDPSLRDRVIIRGNTLDSPYINKDYVLSQIRTRDPASMRAYIYGEFVNLDGALVYWAFDKNKNITTRTMSNWDGRGNPVPLNYIAHCSIDWNKNINATNIHFVENGNTFSVGEINGSVNARELIAKLRVLLKGRSALFYPDASGFEGVSQLEDAFGSENVLYHAANPNILRTVAAVNNRMTSVSGLPTTFVNPNTCPVLFTGYLRQTKDAQGKPDKSKGLDHNLDGNRYFHHWNWPVEDESGTIQSLGANDPTKYNLRDILRN